MLTHAEINVLNNEFDCLKDKILYVFIPEKKEIKYFPIEHDVYKISLYLKEPQLDCLTRIRNIINKEKIIYSTNIVWDFGEWTFEAYLQDINLKDVVFDFIEKLEELIWVTIEVII